MYQEEREYEILEEAINAFRKATKIEIEKTQLEPKLHQKRADATLVIKAGDRALEYLVEIRRTITKATIGMLAHQLRAEKEKWLLVTWYAPRQLAENLRDMGIAFIDMAGNGYINEPPVYIYIQGNRPQEWTWQKVKEDIFSRTGLHVVFALLCNKNLENATYREIAKTANVALGTVGRIIKGLVQKGYLLEMGTHGRRFIKKKELLANWVTNYVDKLRTRQLIGQYETNEFEALQHADIGRFNALWGGEVAADMLTHYLKPEIATIYTRRPINNLLVEFKLHKNLRGRVEIRKQFWDFKTQGEKNTVHPILIYADLIATGNPRNIETAKILYERFIDRFVRED